MTSFPMYNQLLLLRAGRYLQRYRPDLIAISGGYQNLLTAQAISCALRGHKTVRVAQHDYQQPADFSAAVLGIEAAHSWSDALGSLIHSRVQETIQDPEPDVIAPIISARRPGEVDRLARRFPPRLAVLTSTGSAHLDYFSDPATRAHEQAALALAADQADGRVILNIDDPHLIQIRHHLRSRPLTISLHQPADVYCRRLQPISADHLAGLAGEVVIHQKPYELHLPGCLLATQVPSVLAALAIAAHYGLSIPAILQNLKQLRPPAGYLSVAQTSNNITLLNSYQENPPEYLQSLLRAIGKLPHPRKVLILTDIPGLSRFASHWYQLLGQAAASAHLLITIGQDSKQLQSAALKQRRGIDTHHFSRPAEAAKWLSLAVKPHDLVAVAGHNQYDLSPILDRLR